MATFNKETGEIDLSSEDKKVLQEANWKMQNRKTPIADSIIKWVKEGNKNEKDRI